MQESCDAVVIGGGIFGCYAALYLAAKGMRVVLLEKETNLLQKASLVNQARLHSGYHYPRSIATAKMSDAHKERFTAEHRPFIHSTFEKYYAIDRYASFTDAAQFERFCQYLRIPCVRVERHPLFNFERLEAVFRTVEHSFDPVLIAAWYRQRIQAQPNIVVRLQTQVEAAEAERDEWRIQIRMSDRSQPLPLMTLRAPIVINATYTATNAINRLFGVRSLALTHEISEIAFAASPELQNIGFTVMDGYFASIMPYGLSGLLSISSVAYTHHTISYDDLPTFDCQRPQEDPRCRPEAPGICTICPRRPPTNAHKMIAQVRQYLAEGVQLQYFFSYFTIKTKLKASYIDDGRPTEIALLRERPRFYCLFAGKINSIYEIEKML
ncbi:MAG: FAD-binding oxidoreductase [Saprospiraceae bacterium]|nr:FAD-binding oxidoreductase [Saprospiraceae bacterium]MDW8483287.1 FAD-dependent oxidoreductase [Saprospiraceae bacterium]